MPRMCSAPEVLTPAEVNGDHEISCTSHYKRDIPLLNYLLQDLRVLMRRYVKDEIAIDPHQVFSWDVHGLERRIVVCDPQAVIDETDVHIVGFFGDRRLRTDQNQIDASETDLISEFVNYPGILSYSSIELVDHYWANLVVHQRAEDREAWRGSEAHKHAVDTVAPQAYHGVRIHNGCVRGGVTGSQPVFIESTKYWDYDVSPTWHAYRELGDGGWSSQ